MYFYEFNRLNFFVQVLFETFDHVFIVPTKITRWSYNFTCVRSFVRPSLRSFVCPSVCPLIKSFSHCWLIVFSNFLYEVREL